MLALTNFERFLLAFGWDTPSDHLPLPGSEPATPTALDAFEHEPTALGAPYVWGGPPYTQDRFDCSRLMHRACALINMTLARTLAQQRAATQPVTQEELRPDATVFFANTNGPGPTYSACTSATV